MKWDGTALKALARERGIAISRLADDVGVSRQTVNDWMRGQAPKGTHLIGMSKLLGVNPSYFFQDEPPEAVSVPLHRIRGVARITSKMREEARKMAYQYEKLFKWASPPGLVPVLRIESDGKNTNQLAKNLRSLADINNDRPIDYETTFRLLSQLKIVTIFRYFPKDLKGYAFYCQIHNHRVIFVNNDTKIIDLIFPLLHEAIHAIRDEGTVIRDEAKEEVFCDAVANALQLPDEYVLAVSQAIKGRRRPIQINMLKDYSRENAHSIFGIIERLQNISDDLSFDNRSVGGAATNVKKEFPSLGEILFKDKDAAQYINTLNSLTPQFVEIIRNQIDKVTTRKAGEWLGLDSILDAKLAIEAIPN